VNHSNERRSCCGHSVEPSYDGYCTLLTCNCSCRRFCAHLQVTVPGEARRDERLRGAPLYGWCRHCRMKVDDRHIRTLRPERDARMAIYWLGEPDGDAHELEAEIEQAPLNEAAADSSRVASQLSLFERVL
jgi:hypothetical protein